VGLRPAARRHPRPDRRPDLGHHPRAAACGLVVLADKGYIGAGEHVHTPYRGRHKPGSQKAANRAPSSDPPANGPTPS